MNLLLDGCKSAQPDCMLDGIWRDDIWLPARSLQVFKLAILDILDRRRVISAALYGPCPNFHHVSIINGLHCILATLAVVASRLASTLTALT